MAELIEQKPLRRNNDTAEFRAIMLAAMFSPGDFSAVAQAHFKREYFEGEHEKFIFDMFVDYTERYKASPTLKTLGVVLSQSNMPDGVQKEAEGLFDAMSSISVDDYDFRWLVDEAENWCRFRAIHAAVVEAIKVLDNDKKAAELSSLPTILTEAVSVSFNDTEGTDYFKDAEQRYEEYHRRDNKVSTGMEHFDFIFNGGLAEQSLVVILAPTGVGKSIAMCSWSASQLLLGYKVLYITMELSEKMVSKRIDQNLMSCTEEELMLLPKSVFLNKISSTSAQTKGQLVVRNYGAGSGNVNHFRKLLKNLETRRGFIPDVIYVDYLSICGSTRSNRNANSYERIKNVSEEIRAMATEECYGKSRVVTAMQVNRSGYNAQVIDLTHTSDSMGVTFTADAMFALQSSETMRQMGRLKVVQLKNRWGDTYARNAHEIGIDYPHMRLYDLEAQPEYIQADNRNKEQEAVALTPEQRIMNVGALKMFGFNANAGTDDDVEAVTWEF